MGGLGGLEVISSECFDPVDEGRRGDYFDGDWYKGVVGATDF